MWRASLARTALMLLPALQTVARGGQTVYVATGGSDTNSGSSAETAWRTLQKAVDTVQPGDTILVLPGTYAGARIEKSGTTNAPITLRGENGSVLNAAGPSNRHNSILEIETWAPPFVVKHWVIEGLRINNSLLYGIDARSTQHLVLRRHTVYNSRSTGIFAAFCYDMRIEENTCEQNGEHGLYLNNGSDRFTIRGNTLRYNAFAGIHLNGDLSVEPPPGTPWVWDGMLSDGLVEGNTIHDNGPGGAGINMDGVANTMVRNNMLYRTHNNSGIALYRGDGAAASHDNQILNNTVFISADGGWAINLADRACTGNRVFNNVIFNHHSWRGSIVIPAADLEGFECDYNAVRDRFSVDGGGSRITLAAWRALGYGAHSLLAGAVDIVVDQDGEHQHRPGSLGIDRGLDLDAVPHDVEGTTRPLDGKNDGTVRTDLGPYEFVHPLADSDRDGMSDEHELTAGTNPTAAASILAFTTVEMISSTSFVLYWPGVIGRVYAVGTSSNLEAPFTLAASNLSPRPPRNTFTTGAVSVRSFYRLSVSRAE